MNDDERKDKHIVVMDESLYRWKKLIDFINDKRYEREHEDANFIGIDISYDEAARACPLDNFNPAPELLSMNDYIHDDEFKNNEYFPYLDTNTFRKKMKLEKVDFSWIEGVGSGNPLSKRIRLLF